MNNFKCKCGEEFLVSYYRMSIKPEKNLYYYKNTNTLVSCPQCKSNEIKPIEKPGDYSTATLGTYTMKSIDKRKEGLKERSHKHFVKEIRDKQIEINRDPSLQKLD